jgi:predicted MFS family arabinose efflux permease
MAEGLGVSQAMAGQSVTAFALTFALLAPVIATATSTIARRRLLVCSLSLLGLSNLASAVSPTLATLILTRIAAACSAAAYTPNAGAVAAAIVRPALRGRGLAVVIGGLTVATALGVPIARIASSVMGWRASLVLVGIISFVAAVGVFAVMPQIPGNPRVPLRLRFAVLRRPGVLIILPLTVLGMAACYTPYAFTVEVLHALRIPAPSITLMLLAYGLGAVVGNHASGWATDQFGPARVLSSAYALMAFALGALAWSAGAPTQSAPTCIATLMAFWGASSWAQSPAQQHRLIAATPHDASLVVALNSSCIYFGIAIGTAIGGDAIGTGAATALWCGCALAALALIYVLVTGRRRDRG